MRRITLFAVLLAVLGTPTAAAAKLPFFGLDVAPLRPRVGEPITITMTCYEDADRTQASPSCFGAGDSMAWVHPLDREGSLDQQDWLAVAGRATSAGTVRGTLVLAEPGSYDVLPLWRTWTHGHSRGFPDPIRIEVVGDPPILAIGAAASGLLGFLVAAVAWRRRTLASRSAGDRRRAAVPAGEDDADALAW